MYEYIHRGQGQQQRNHFSACACNNSFIGRNCLRELISLSGAADLLRLCVMLIVPPSRSAFLSLSLNAYPVKNREPKNYSRNSNTLGVSFSFQRLSLFKRITKVIITLLDRVVEASCWFLISAASNRNFCKKSMPSSIQ